MHADQVVQKKNATLYIVATPIGNLEDITSRALRVLSEVPWILCEDTRHTAHLLKCYNLNHKKLISCHQFNESQRVEKVLSILQQGEDIALVSDAGTPAICDPGFLLINQVRRFGYSIVPLPGACALINALAISGLPGDSFYFAGFLPAKANEKRAKIKFLSDLEIVWICYEAPHRIMDTVKVLTELLDSKQQVVLVKELTKIYENILIGSAHEVYEQLENNKMLVKGEFVLLVEGKKVLKNAQVLPEAAVKMLEYLINMVGVKEATQSISTAFNLPKNIVYRFALSIKTENKTVQN